MQFREVNERIRTPQSSAVETMFSVRETPWHGLGVVIADYQSAEEAIKTAGLDWTVRKEPIFVGLKTADYPFIKPTHKNGRINLIESKWATVRSNDARVLGVVGDDYTCFQNTEAFAWCDSILQSGELVFETAGSLQNGRIVWVCAKIPQSLRIAGDKVDEYLVIVNSHDGSSALRVFITPIRVVCQNTLNLALRSMRTTFSVRHTRNYEQRMGEARRALQITSDYFKSFEEIANEMLAQAFSRTQFENLAAKVLRAPSPQNVQTERGLKVAQTAFENRRAALMNCYNADDLDNIRNTAWGAYNAVADYSDHARQVKGTSSQRERLERLFERSFADTELKDLTLRELVRVR
jgi:phage/plasmid-like protein (TIGR03299 family)